VAGGIAPAQMAEFILYEPEVMLCDLLKQVGFAASNGEARRGIAGRGVKIDGVTVESKMEALHNEILSNSEEVLQALELPYRVMLACTGEIGIRQIKKHEIETWMPSRNAYCETYSCSSFGDFQARRSNIKYRDKDGATKYCFTLNNTGIASPRIFIPLLELYQLENGSVRIPKVLQPYMGGMEAFSKRGSPQ
jgi:seryl-tRNA synthetase